MTAVPVPGDEGGRTPAPAPKEPPSPEAAPAPLVQRVSGPLAVIAAWLAVALAGAGAIARLPVARGGVLHRVAHHAIDLGHTLLIGLVVAAGVALYQRWRRRRLWVALALIAIVAAGVAQIVLKEDLGGLVESLGADPDRGPAVGVAAALAALVVPAVFALGVLLSRPRLRWLGVALGLGAIIANLFILPSGYPGIHLVIATSGATLLAAALEGARSPFARPLRPPRIALGVVALLASAGAVASVALRPSSSVQTELLRRDDTALLVPWLSWVDTPASIAGVDIPPKLRPWFVSRANRGDVGPTPNRLLPDDGIVILVTIDALRLDLMQKKYRDVAPSLHKIKKRSVYFSQARSGGSDTRVSLSTLFTGRYFSMLEWSSVTAKKPTFETDLLPRIPEVLGKHGVRSAHFNSLNKMLLPKHGIARGFTEDYAVTEGLPSEEFSGEDLVSQAIQRLKRDSKGPLFFYMHLLEPHAPYYPHGAGKKSDSDWERYLQEVKFVDGQVGRLYRTVHELGLEKRTAFIVSADHGEGFGENGVYFHNRTLYDVMVHVPLMIQLPSVAPREVDQPVSMADIGPTVFDLFHVPTPGFWMTESLVPFLNGGRADPDRLMMMETRTEYGVVFPDLLKVTVRVRKGTQEIYDLTRDPEEKQNLRDTLGPEGDRLIALARAFATVHAGRRKDGLPF